MKESSEYWDNLENPEDTSNKIPIQHEPELKESFDPNYWSTFDKEVLGTSEQVLAEYETKRKESIGKLKTCCDINKIVLVLGAGVSASCGLHSWDTLVSTLLLNIWSENPNLNLKDIPENLFEKSTSLHPIVVTRFIRQLIKENFNKTVHEELYKSYQYSSSVLLDEIIAWCCAGKVDSILTYNFDDILEQNLEQRNIPYKTVSKNFQGTQNAQLVIYHVHGFLPQNEDDHKKNSSSIIFSEEDYHGQYQEFYNWNTLIQLDKYRNHTCLFIGTSLTDPNQRRLLEVSKEYHSQEMQHYIFRKRMGTSNETLNKIWDHVFQRIDEAFGISTIWVEKHDNIPEILKEIREVPPMT